MLCLIGCDPVTYSFCNRTIGFWPKCTPKNVITHVPVLYVTVCNVPPMFQGGLPPSFRPKPRAIWHLARPWRPWPPKPGSASLALRKMSQLAKPRFHSFPKSLGMQNDLREYIYIYYIVSKPQQCRRLPRWLPVISRLHAFIGSQHVPNKNKHILRSNSGISAMEVMLGSIWNCLD